MYLLTWELTLNFSEQKGSFHLPTFSYEDGHQKLMNFHKVCNSLVECCNTGKLDNSFHDDFRGKLIDRWKNFQYPKH